MRSLRSKKYFKFSNKNKDKKIFCQVFSIENFLLFSGVLLTQSKCLSKAVAKYHKEVRKNNHAGRVLGLPAALNANAVEWCLAFLHGHTILENPNCKKHNRDIYIAACYLQIPKLVQELEKNLKHTDKENSKGGKLFDGVRAIVKQLAIPKVFLTIPNDVKRLP